MIPEQMPGEVWSEWLPMNIKQPGRASVLQSLSIHAANPQQDRSKNGEPQIAHDDDEEDVNWD